MKSLYKIVFVLSIAVCSCVSELPDHSLKVIRERKQLRVLIRANSSDYFLYNGNPMGFQLELAQHFADYLGVDLYAVPVRNSEETYSRFRNGSVDMIVSNIEITGIHSGESFCYFPFDSVKNIAWEIRCSADSLCATVRYWIDSITQTRTFSDLFYKYHLKPRRDYVKSDTVSLKQNKISPYDDAIKSYSSQLNWDWRLLASLIYQESKFHTNDTSRKGAMGIMQLMPDVAEKYGITAESAPEEHILAGVKHLQEIDRMLPADIPKSHRLPFVIASYNVGVGHILDARRLAEVHGKDPNLWFYNVEVELLKKSDPYIVRDSIVRHGYARADETYNFVRDIFSRWHHYRNLVKS